MDSSHARLEKVIKALEKVNDETKQVVLNMAKNMSELEVIQSFNQNSLDFFNLTTSITTRLGVEAEYKMGGYKNLYDTTLKINVKMPIDHYTLIVLEYASEIYSENEDFFLMKQMGDATLEVANEFSMVKSEMFKRLWKTLNASDKAAIKEKMLLLTTFAHVYFYQTVLKQKK